MYNIHDIRIYYLKIILGLPYLNQLLSEQQEAWLYRVDAPLLWNLQVLNSPFILKK